MSHGNILTLLAGFEKRLVSISDQAVATLNQAQATVDRLNRLREDIDQLRARFLASVDTGVHPVLPRQSSTS